MNKKTPFELIVIWIVVMSVISAIFIFTTVGGTVINMLAGIWFIYSLWCTIIYNVEKYYGEKSNE